MKSFYTLIIVLFNSLLSYAQFVNESGITLGGTDDDWGRTILSDSSGNLVMAGIFSSTVDFDPGAGIFNLTSNGGRDIFIQKLDSNGNLLWVKQIGGQGTDDIQNMILDDKGAIYLTGAFQDTVDFDPGLDTYNLICSAITNAFILKLDANGNFVWVNQISGSRTVKGNAITIDVNGDLITTGYFTESAFFDDRTSIDTLTSLGELDAFFYKTDTMGKIKWIKHVGGPEHDQGSAIATDLAGNIIIMGYFDDTVDFDPGPGTETRTTNGAGDVFILKLDANGNFLWVNQIGGTNNDYSNSILADENGSIYALGRFTGTADFDPGPGTVSLRALGAGDMFIQKLKSDGNHIWVKQIGGADSAVTYANGYSHFLDLQKNIYITGNFRQSVDFNPGIEAKKLISRGEYDIFIQQLDSNGNLNWVKQIGSSDYDGGYSIFPDRDGHFYMCGYFGQTAYFDCGLGIDSATNNGERDILLLKIYPCLPTTIVDVSTNLDGVTITAGSENACYQWLDCDEEFEAISGETNRSYTPTENGYYAVEITENNCIDTSKCIMVELTGITKFGSNDELSIYPNPTNGRIFIEVGSQTGPGTLIISDIMGKTILHQEFNAIRQLEIDIQGPSGMYFLEFISDKRIQSKRIIKR
jgi:hypothetical protein